MPLLTLYETERKFIRILWRSLWGRKNEVEKRRNEKSRRRRRRAKTKYYNHLIPIAHRLHVLYVPKSMPCRDCMCGDGNNDDRCCRQCLLPAHYCAFAKAWFWRLLSTARYTTGKYPNIQHVRRSSRPNRRHDTFENSVLWLQPENTRLLTLCAPDGFPILLSFSLTSLTRNAATFWIFLIYVILIYFLQFCIFLLCRRADDVADVRIAYMHFRWTCLSLCPMRYAATAINFIPDAEYAAPM